VSAEGISPYSGGTVPDLHRVPSPHAYRAGPYHRSYNRRVDHKEVGDRQLDALLQRLDRLSAELHAMNRRLDAGEHLAPLVHELRALNESLSALAYAALGQQGPHVRRRRAS
jgi:DNA-binding FrmR family transcriptional regulator